LPGFTNGDQQTELNQPLLNGRQQIALSVCRKNVGVVSRKNGGQKLYTFGRFSTSSRLNGEYLRKET